MCDAMATASKTNAKKIKTPPMSSSFHTRNAARSNANYTCRV